MQILKTTTLIAIFSIKIWYGNAQTDAAMQKAFSESYTYEYYKKYSEAISVLEKIYKADHYESNLRLGWLCLSNKAYPQAAAYYQKAIDLKPYSVEAKLGIVKVFSAQESWDKVAAQYEAVLNIDDKNYTAGYWLGVIQYNRKKYESAIKLFEKLINLYPFDYDLNHMLAWSYLNAGRNNDAKILFNKALLIKPADASCLEGLSKIK